MSDPRFAVANGKHKIWYQGGLVTEELDDGVIDPDSRVTKQAAGETAAPLIQDWIDRLREGGALKDFQQVFTNTTPPCKVATDAVVGRFRHFLATWSPTSLLPTESVQERSFQIGRRALSFREEPVGNDNNGSILIEWSDAAPKGCGGRVHPYDAPMFARNWLLRVRADAVGRGAAPAAPGLVLVNATPARAETWEDVGEMLDDWLICSGASSSGFVNNCRYQLGKAPRPVVPTDKDEAPFKPANAAVIEQQGTPETTKEAQDGCCMVQTV